MAHINEGLVKKIGDVIAELMLIKTELQDLSNPFEGTHRNHLDEIHLRAEEDDEELWNRRIEERKKMEIGPDPPPKVSRPDEVIMKLTALTKLTPDAQATVLFGIYKDAVKTVKELVGSTYSAQNPHHEQMVAEMSEKLLGIWMKSNE